MLEWSQWGWSLGAWVLGISAWTAVVYLLVRGLDGGTRRLLCPRVRVLLYAAVLVRLVLPLDYASPIGLVQLGGAEAPAPVQTAGPDAFAAANEALEAPHIELLGAQRPSTDAAVVSTRTPVPSLLGLNLLFVYLAGVIACVGLWLLRERRLREWIAASTLRGHVDAGIELREHAFAGPFAHGLLRRVIVIPKGLAQRLEPAVFARLLAHERAHHAHGDPWIVAALMAVAALAWPVVPVWLTLRRVRSLLEQAADERALADAAAPLRRAYGRALIQLVDHGAPAPALGAFGQLASRIEALTCPVSTSRKAQLGLATTAAVVLAACMAPGVEPDVDSDDDVEARSAACEQLGAEATSLHDRAERGEATFEDAIAAYDRYIAACSDAPEYAKLVYYAGEARWALAHASGEPQRYREAAALFRRAAEFDGEFQTDAATGQLIALLNATELKQPARPADASFARIEYSAEERELIDGWARYVEVVGRPLTDGHSEQLKMAELFMWHNDFAAARPELEELVEASGDVLAAEMLVDLLTIAWLDPDIEPAEALARGETLERWLRRIEAMPLYHHADADRLREAVPVLLAGVEWKRAMADMAAGEAGDIEGYRRCAERFAALLDVHPDVQQREAIERNAATCRAAFAKSP